MGALQRILPETFSKRLNGVETIEPGQHFTIGDIDVHAFAIPHDAVDPIGFTFRRMARRWRWLRIWVTCRTGESTSARRGLLMLESNHDLDMLKVGPYPW